MREAASDRTANLDPVIRTGAGGHRSSLRETTQSDIWVTSCKVNDKPLERRCRSALHVCRGRLYASSAFQGITSAVRNLPGARIGMESKSHRSALRRAQPLNKPLPSTVRWVASLPAAVQPLALLQQFPRIANRLALAWHDQEATAECFDDLLVDRRGGRQGFPPDVQRELSVLREYVALRLFRG
jgi:hypothetical protein